MTTRSPISTSRRGFTVIELLVVIVIIAILVGLVAGAGVAVIGNRKVKLTEDVLSSLDRALSDFMVANGDTPPPYIPEQYENTPGTGYHPDAGGDNDSGNPNAWGTLSGQGYPRHPDAAVFIRAARGFGAVDSILEGLGDRWLVATPEPASTNVNAVDGSPSVLDAWADPAEWITPWPVLGQTTIYYVDPRNELAQRLYGRCVGGRPYFFSAGPDRLYGSSTHVTSDGALGDASEKELAEKGLADNVYSYKPGAADLTDAFRMTTR